MYLDFSPAPTTTSSGSGIYLEDMARVRSVQVISLRPSLMLHISLGYLNHSLSENLSSYAAYLDTRVRAYRDLKHDIIRIQNENNREERLSGGESSRQTNGSSSYRGKKLRQMTVEKGLLRETKGVQRQIDSLLQCKVRDLEY